MSLLAGLFHPDGAPAEPAALVEALASGAGLDPAACGHWQDRGIALVQAPSGVAHLEGHAAAFDGRLDGRRALAEALGLDLADEPAQDARLALAAYRRWGTDAFAHLLGDFACALWDPSRQQLVCARDFLGSRPLYVAPLDGRFAFASDLRALARLVPPQVDEGEVARYVVHGAGDRYREETFFRSIRRLPPATWFSVGRGGMQRGRYWEAARIPPLPRASFEDCADQGRDLLRRAVACRIQGVERAGVHLSGGLDSSCLTVLAARAARPAGVALKAYSWSPPPAGAALPGSEHRRIEAVLGQEGLSCGFLALSAERWQQNLDWDVATRPAFSAFLEDVVLSQAAAEGRRRMLSGWGGDETLGFWGWGHASELLRRGRWRELLALVRRGAEVSRSPRGAAALGASLWQAAVLPLLPDLFYNRVTPPPADGPSGQRLLHPRLRQGMDTSPTSPRPFRQLGSTRRNRVAVLEHGWLTQRMEAWAAIAAPRGIDHAYPFLDRRVVEFGLGLPSRAFHEGPQRRPLLRRIAEPLLPAGLAQDPALKAEPALVRTLDGFIEDGLRAAAARLAERRRDLAGNPWIDVDAVLATASRTRLDSPPAERGALARAVQVLALWQKWGR